MNGDYDHLKEYLDRTMKDETRKLISDFAILWNKYENHLFNNFYRYEKIDTLIKRLDYSEKFINSIENIFLKLEEYMKKKYISFEYMDFKEYFEIIIIKYDFNRQDWKKGDIKEDYLKELLLHDDFEKKLKLLLLVVGRVRNNMFHGLKSANQLDDQQLLFIICNELLSTILYNTCMMDL